MSELYLGHTECLATQEVIRLGYKSQGPGAISEGQPRALGHVGLYICTYGYILCPPLTDSGKVACGGTCQPSHQHLTTLHALQAVHISPCREGPDLVTFYSWDSPFSFHGVKDARRKHLNLLLTYCDLVRLFSA